MFAKDVKAGYPEFKASGVITDVIKALDSQTTDLKKFIEKFETTSSNFEFFYLLWILFFDPIPKESLTKEKLLSKLDSINEISKLLITFSS